MARTWKLWVATLPALLLVVVLSGSMIVARPPSLMRSALSEYRAEIGKLKDETTIIPARFPYLFTEEMSRESFSKSWYYHTTHRFAETEKAQTISIRLWTDHDKFSYDGSLRALPYPPVDAWCVQLKDTKSQQSRVVLVAQHNDLYNADWVVHELAQGEDDKQARLLAEIGCKFEVQ